MSPTELRSAQKLFNTLADAIKCIVKEVVVQFLWHYLDDFITIGRPDSGECELNRDIFHQVCKLLGFPWQRISARAQHKYNFSGERDETRLLRETVA